MRVEHFLPTELDQLPAELFDLFINIDDGLDYVLPSCLRPSALWAIDTHLEFDRSLRKARSADYVFAAQKDGAERLRQRGVSSAIWLPLACDPELHGQCETVSKEYDVGFVGNVLPGIRAELLDRVQASYPRTFVGIRYFREMTRLYCASRIVFNRGIKNDINMRVFEGLASGSLLLTNELAANGQSELFQDGEHLATYRDSDDLLDKIAWYLKHDSERERIASAGRVEVLDKHTYLHRMQSLLATVEGDATCEDNEVKSPTVVPVAEHPSGSSKSQTYYQFERPEVVALVPEHSRRILDVGCGAGRLGAAIKARQSTNVVGLELDPAAADLAKQSLDEVVLGNVEHANVEFADASFDCVICADVLEHMEDPESVLLKVNRWLSNVGRLVASIPNVRHHSVLRSLLDGNFNYEPAGFARR